MRLTWHGHVGNSRDTAVESFVCSCCGIYLSAAYPALLDLYPWCPRSQHFAPPGSSFDVRPFTVGNAARRESRQRMRGLRRALAIELGAP